MDPENQGELELQETETQGAGKPCFRWLARQKQSWDQNPVFLGPPGTRNRSTPVLSSASLCDRCYCNQEWGPQLLLLINVVLETAPRAFARSTSSVPPPPFFSFNFDLSVSLSH